MKMENTMLPLILELSEMKIILVGSGEQLIKRLKILNEAKAKHLVVYSEDSSEELELLAANKLKNHMPLKGDFDGVRVAFIAGLNEQKSAELAHIAKERNILINIEDYREWCDFHMPSIVRRGNLLITCSTGGASPRFTQRIRERLDELFDDGWKEYLQEIAELRKIWKSEGVNREEIIHKTDMVINRNGWIKRIK